MTGSDARQGNSSRFSADRAGCQGLPVAPERIVSLSSGVDAIGKAGGGAAHLGDEGVEQAFFPSFRNTVQQAAYRLPHRLQDLGAAEPQRLVHREFGSGTGQRGPRVARHGDAASVRVAATAAPDDELGRQHEDVFHLLAAETLEEDLDGEPALLPERLSDRGEGRRRVAGLGDIVESDDGYVPWHTHVADAQCVDCPSAIWSLAATIASKVAPRSSSRTRTASTPLSYW